MLKRLVILVSFGFCIASASAAFQDTQNPNRNTQQQNVTVAPAGSTTLGQSRNVSPGPTAPGCDEACQQGHENLRIQGRLAWFTGGLVLVGFLQVALIGWQAVLLRQTRGEIQKQAEQMQAQAAQMCAQTEILKDSVAAAQKSADAAIAQIQVTAEKERARLFVVGAGELIGGLVQHAEFSGKYRFGYLNVGPTPAINVSFRYGVIASEFETAPHGKPNRLVPFPFVIAPNSSETVPLDLTAAVPLQDTGDIPRAFFIYVFGEVEYDDVISTDRRSTRFQLRFRVKQIKDDGTAVQDGEWQRSGDPEDNFAT